MKFKFKAQHEINYVDGSITLTRFGRSDRKLLKFLVDKFEYTIERYLLLIYSREDNTRKNI